MSTRTYLSIGDVLSLLRQEFPDITISKIRFLESQGLVDPERSPSGYRKFYEHDVDRLRWVLRQQREHFLPLKVIRDRLVSNGGDISDFDDLDGPVDLDDLVEEETEDAPTVIEDDTEAWEPDGSEPSTSPEEERREVGVVAAARQADGHEAERDDDWRRKTAALGRDVRATNATTPRPSAERASARAEPSAPAAEPEPPAPATEPEPPTPAPRRAETPPSEVGASLTLDELCAASGLGAIEVAAIEGFGLIEPLVVGGALYYDEEGLAVARLVADFGRFGIEPRHLRLFRNAVDRELGLIEQVVTPLLRQRNPEARQRAVETAAELSRLGQTLRAGLLRRALRHHLGG